MSVASFKLLVVAPRPDSQEMVSKMRAVSGWHVAVEDDPGLAMAHFRTMVPDVVVLFEGSDSSELSRTAKAVQSGSHGRPASIVLIAGQDSEQSSDIPWDAYLSATLGADEMETQITTSCREVSAKRIRVAMDMAIESFVSDAMVGLSASADTVFANQREALIAPKPAMKESSPIREQTEVLDMSSMGRLAVPEEPLAAVSETVAGFVREDTLSVDIDELDRVDPTPGLDMPAPNTASDFARQLREKMSKMAERLFPEEMTGDNTISVVHSSSVEEDFDLEEVGLTELSENASEHSMASDFDLVSDSDIRRDRADYQPLEEKEEKHTLSFSGELGADDNDVSRLIARFWHTRFTGWATFRHQDRELRLDFEEGRVVFVASMRSDDRMGELLVRQGKINREQLASCQAQVSASGRRMGELLVELGYLKPRELLPAVRQHLEDLFYSLFAWTEGSYEAVTGETDDEKIRLSRHPAALLVEGVRRKYDRDRLNQCLGDEDTLMFALPSEALSKTMSSAELTLAETKAHALFLGEHSLMEIAKSCGLKELSVAQLAFAWVCLGVAEVVSGDMEGHTRPGRGTQPLIGDSDIEIDRERTLAKHRLVEKGDYFQVLGVREDASAFEIKRAYEAAQRYYQPEALPSELRSELAEVLSEIEEVIEEAYQVLSNDTIRQQYRTHMKSPGE